MKNILVTGANKGLGFEISRQLGKKGYHMIITGRNKAGLASALDLLLSENVSAEIIVMDVSDDESVSRAASQVSERNMKLEVLINNAGISTRQDRSLLEDDISVLRTIMETNGYGPLRVIKAFLPHMSKPSSIINISSTGGSMSESVGGWSPAYCTSKTFLNAITRHLSHTLADMSISVNAVCPGWTRTDMGGKSAPRSVEKGAETPVWLASEVPFRFTGKFFRDKAGIRW